MEDEDKGNVDTVFCGICRTETRQLVLKSYASTWGEGAHWGSDRYQIIRCEPCGNIHFRRLSWRSDGPAEASDSESLPDAVGESGRVWRESQYPAPERWAAKSFPHVPSSIQRIYEDTIEAYNRSLHLFCAGGLRGLVESISLARNIHGGSLRKKIDQLFREGVLTQSEARILHAFRSLGNDALHELNPPSPDELEIGLDIIEHILESLYEMPQKIEALTRKTRERKKVALLCS
jgi:hypothetical protein